MFSKKYLFCIYVLLLLVKYSYQECCYLVSIIGDGQSLYFVDVTVKPPNELIKISYVEDYDVKEPGSTCQSDGYKQYKCNGSSSADYFLTRFKMNQLSGGIINSITMDVVAGNDRCSRSFDTCASDGTIESQNGDNFCFGVLGCFPKLACYIGIGVFVVMAIGIIITIYRRNSGSGEAAALDRPNTKDKHRDTKRESIFNFNKWRNNSNNSSNKETLIQFDEIPIDSKEAGKTPWINKKSSLPTSNNIGGLGSGAIGLGSGAIGLGSGTIGLGSGSLGLGSGGLGSNNALLPQSSVVKVHNDPGAGTGLKHTRSVKRAPSSRHVKSVKKNTNRMVNDDDDIINSFPKSNLHDHIINVSQPSSPSGKLKSKSSNLNRTKSSRSTRSTKSIKKTRTTTDSYTSPKRPSSIRHQQNMRYQIPSDSESSSDSDNEVLGLRAKPSLKKIGGSSSIGSSNVRHHSTRKSQLHKTVNSRY